MSTESVVIKARGRFEGKTINGSHRFGYCSSVFYDIKIAQTGSIIRVKHYEDESKDNILIYANIKEFFNQWTIFKVW